MDERPINQPTLDTAHDMWQKLLTVYDKVGGTEKIKTQKQNMITSQYSRFLRLPCFGQMNHTNKMWYLDNGSTEHMSSNREWIESSRPCSRDVKISDGSIIKAEAIGEVRVASLKINPFSINTIVEKELEMSFNKFGCRVLDANRNCCATAVKRDKLFEMQFKIERNSFHAGGQKQFRLKEWHQRLAHQNFRQVRSVLKRFGIDFKDNEDECCTSCLEGKQHRFPFYSSTTKYNNVGEMVGTDLCGPMEVASIEGIAKKKKKKNRADGEDESVASYDLRERCLLNKPMYLEDYSMLSAVSFDENLTYSEATSGPDREYWKLAIEEEIKPLSDNETWTVVDRLMNEKIVDSKWVYKIKNDEDAEEVQSTHCEEDSPHIFIERNTSQTQDMQKRLQSGAKAQIV
ncbi:hypothetical protein ILUMI_02012 [Ignelater luminosus]|uniref:GAG-pre-integrase domain-containing protein n=1 Tax=Ignelater luminosus TaxID=2038154 RepID=A0A8K0DDH6_IGNLU|nr:hypothetical protein ILUMI_02012 [Ignelater luminosus]